MERFAPLFRDNIKVYFASLEQYAYAVILKTVGVRYGLWSCFPFLAGKFGLHCYGFYPKYRDTSFFPRVLPGMMKNSILDSGIFTLVSQGFSGTNDARLLEKWYDRYIEFILTNGITSTCVEYDCQKILGAVEAWKYRERMKDDLPQNRQINVFHIEDGRRGLDRLIEFSDYIAIAALEWRGIAPQTWERDIIGIAKYIKARKSSIDIHLLGCTSERVLRRADFCTSCDSISWVYRGAYRQFQSNTRIKDDARQYDAYLEKVVQHLETLTENPITPQGKRSFRAKIISADLYKHFYTQVAGSQD